MVTKNNLHSLLNFSVDINNPTISIYCNKKSVRLNYVCEFIFNTVLKVNYNIYNSITEFEKDVNFKVNYSEEKFTNALQLVPCNLLFDNIVAVVNPVPFFKNDIIYVFETSNSCLHFDIFAAVFYFISRMEEWQSFEADTHQRFEAKNSILFQNNNHLKPVVEVWIEELKLELQKFYPKIIFPNKQFKIISTIDVDNLFAFKNKGFLRTSGGIAKDILKLDFKNLKARINVLSGKKKDPFDIYESVSDFCAKQNITLIYFFLFKTGTKYDRTVNPKSLAFKNVFKTVKDKNALIGLHPSYNSSVNKKLLQQEILNFSEALNKKVTISRQHYLRFNIKTTPKQLLQNGILADFSMGFASHVGFRAGTSQPFYYYDFTNEKKTDLLFIPFCAMDGAYLVYDKITPAEALNSLLNLANEIKKVNGLFITIYHERTFYNAIYNVFGSTYKKLYLEILK